MLIIIREDYGQLSLEAARIVANAIRQNPRVRLGLATGDTPLGLYRELIRLHREEGLDFSHIVTFNLDEYVGLAPSHPCSYHRYMHHHLFDHVNVDPQHLHLLSGTAEQYESHCEAYEAAILTAGGIDLQVLGIGKDGHIGFNEPTSSLASRTGVVALTKPTLADNRRSFGPREAMPQWAVTMGIGTILEARRILLLASGRRKAAAVARAVEGSVTAAVTASALQLHPEATIILDREAAAALRHRDYYERVLEMTGKIMPRRLW